MNPNETISFYRSGRAYAAKREGGHITGDYDIVSDAKDESGNRVIVLKEHDLTEHDHNLDELVNALTQKLDPTSRLFPQILRDTLVDYNDDDIMRLLAKVRKGVKVTPKEGCFKLYIGDGRKRSAEEIMIRG